MRKTIVLGVGAVALMASLTACGGDKAKEHHKDAPRTGAINTTPATVVEMPDGFSNLATKCISPGIRGTVVFHNNAPYGAVSTVNDPTC